MSLRNQFLLRPDIIFFNHGSFGACPRPVFEAYQAWQRELEREPVEFLGRRYNDLLHAARQSLGAYIGADSDDIVYVPNATYGLNIVARSLSLQSGDEVLTTDHEYGALDRTWEFVCGKTGARYVKRHIALPLQSAQQVVDTIWAGVTPRTRVLFMSHITSPTAIIFPIAELVKRARSAGLMTVVDGAHVPGHVPLDIRALDADFYCGNCHKWMMGPKGSAFLYARRGMQDILEPLVVNAAWRSEKRVLSKFLDENQWQGTREIAAFLAIPTAIKFMSDHDWPQVQRDCHELVRYAREQVSALTGLPPLLPDSSAWFGQMAILPVPPCDLETLMRRLYDELKIEIPVTDWNKGHFLRISIQAYNTHAEVDALTDALKLLLPQVSAEGRR